MGATTDKAMVTAALRERVNGARSEWKATERDFKDAAAKLADALQQGDMRLIQSARRVLEAATRTVAHQIGFTDKIITDLRAVQDAAEDDAPALKEAAKLIAEIGAISAAAAKMFQAAKKLMATADAKIDELAKSNDELDRKWAKGDAYLRAQCEERTDAAKKMSALVAKAEKAAKSGDAKTLATLQKEAAKPPKFRITLSQLRADLKKIVDGVDADHVAAELRKQIDADIKAWATLMRGAEADEVRISMDRDTITELKVREKQAA